MVGCPLLQFIPAVDGQNLESDELYPGCRLKRGEIGCFISHMEVWRTMSHGIAIVLEDDQSFVYARDNSKLTRLISKVDQMSNGNWDMISFGYYNEHLHFYEDLGDGVGKLRPGYLLPSAMSYVIKKAAAERLLRAFASGSCWPVDHYMATHDLEIYASFPSMTAQSIVDSDIR